MSSAPFNIYLAGNIKKGKEDDHELTWGEAEKAQLRSALAALRPAFLDPAQRSDDLSDQVSVFGRDLFHVSSSQLVMVDARGKRGLGVGAEMMFAKMQRIPVVAWLPANSHYQRPKIDLLGQEVANWIHPFVFNLCDYLAPTLEEAARWVQEELLPGKVGVKGTECVREAIDHYVNTSGEMAVQYL